MIREEFLHFLWKNNLFEKEYLQYRGEEIKVIDTGQHNKSSGPDFFNARIRIGDTVWAGNIEIHVKASDWFLHKHDQDPAYDNIILHMVYEPDMAVYRKNGEEIPFARLGFPPSLIEKFKELTAGTEEKKCYRIFKNAESIFYYDWIGKLGISRLERRVGETMDLLHHSHYDWNVVLYRLLAVAFGAKQNTYPFQMLTQSVPLELVYKNRDNPLTLNAIFFGQAGFLDETISDDSYYLRLQREYYSTRKKLPEPLPGKHIWKLMRSRPPSFPSVRIPQFISMVRNTFPLADTMLKMESLDEIKTFLRKSINNYWTEHFLYGLPGRRAEYMPADRTLHLWILNGVVPFLFCYGKVRKREEFIQLSLKLMEELPAESNEILKKWNKFGIKASNAFDSQALIELKNRYCDKSLCLECMIGHKIMVNAGKERQA